MILVDTNIVIDFWKRPTEKAQKIFENEEISIKIQKNLKSNKKYVSTTFLSYLLH